MQDNTYAESVGPMEPKASQKVTASVAVGTADEPGEDDRALQVKVLTSSESFLSASAAARVSASEQNIAKYTKIFTKYSNIYKYMK